MKIGDVSIFKKIYLSNLTNLAAHYASLFDSTYISEKKFTIMKINKSKLRSRITYINLEAVIRLVSSKLNPDISKIIKK